MKDKEDVKRDTATISGRTDGPVASDDTDIDRRAEDNKNRFEQENSANGLDSQQVRGGQDGRNDRAIASTDMDSKNGILRMGDTANSTLELTDKGRDAAVADELKTNTAMVDVTTHGPDDYGSVDKVPVPKAQEAAKKQNDRKNATRTTKAQQHEAALAETGTDLTNKPTY